MKRETEVIKIQDMPDAEVFYEMRKDALIKARGLRPGERCFSLMYWLEGLARNVSENGLYVLEEAASEVPPEIGFSQEIQLAAWLVGCWPDDAIEILTARYWAEQYQGEDAVLYFMISALFLRFQEDMPERLAEYLLVACLPGEAAGQYADWKKQRQFPEQEPTLAWHMLNSEPGSLFNEGGLRVVKKLLEEKIAQADEAMLEKIHDFYDRSYYDQSLYGFCGCLEDSIRALSCSARKKLFSVLPDKEVAYYAKNWEHGSVVSQNNIIAAMAKMIAVFEELQEAGAQD